MTREKTVLKFLALSLALCIGSAGIVQAEGEIAPAGPMPAKYLGQDYEVGREGAQFQQDFEELTVGNYFICAIPRAWGKDDNPFGLSPEEKKIYGITLYGPESGVVSTRMSVHYFAEGNVLYKSMDQYIKLHSAPIFVLGAGDNYGPVEPLIVSGRAAKVFERQKNEFVAMPSLSDFDKPEKDDGKVYERREMMATPVPVLERFVVVPAKSGFYALRYYASAENFPRFLAIFAQVTASFRALQ